MKRCFGFVLCCTFFLSLWLAAMDESASRSLSDKVLRLHVIAASDSETDQQQKLLVRDAVLETLTPVMTDCGSLQEAEAAVEALLPELQTAAEEALRQSGSTDAVRLSLSDETYPLRNYTFFSLPGGRYRSLRIRIGPAAGHNWWCVVFPPLCMAAAEEDAEEAMAYLEEPERQLITADGRILRFRVLDWWKKLQSRR